MAGCLADSTAIASATSITHGPLRRLSQMHPHPAPDSAFWNWPSLGLRKHPFDNPHRSPLAVVKILAYFRDPSAVFKHRWSHGPSYWGWIRISVHGRVRDPGGSVPLGPADSCLSTRVKENAGGAVEFCAGLRCVWNTQYRTSPSKNVEEWGKVQGATRRYCEPRQAQSAFRAARCPVGINGVRDLIVGATSAQRWERHIAIRIRQGGWTFKQNRDQNGSPSPDLREALGTNRMVGLEPGLWATFFFLKEASHLTVIRTFVCRTDGYT
ncbi:hypothetical protein F5148DRAFT_1153316 [Russula earlei]|uniref:Uncharacterized protein n=1 Tax=Russula earlei TaxID=71964 RepID=A0ACC0TUN7_9AGAM|nr:hypothetical protein F5148DRAFT_1153316 [Russula earlei]